MLSTGRIVAASVAAGVALMLATVTGAQAPGAPEATARRFADVRVIAIEAPARTEGTWRYTVEMAPGARLVSAAQGAAAPARALMLSVQLTGSLAAGSQQVGVVRFTNGAATVERPLRLAVTARRQVEVTVARALRAARVGEVLYLPFTITNRGNAPDSLRLQLSAPSGWQSSVTSASGVLWLAPGGAAVVTVRIRPPVTLAAGSGLVTLRANGAASGHDASVLVEVGENRVHQARGPELVLGAASIGGTDGALRQAWSLAMHGDVANGLSVDATLATRLTNDPMALRSAALLGVPMGGNHLRLSGALGTIEAGRVALRLPELGGLGLGGDGVALDWRVQDGSVLQVALAHQAGALGAGGMQAAVQWASREAPLTLHLGASLLDERRSTGRHLEAFSAGARFAPSRSGALSIDLAERAFDGGRGLGFGSEFTWDAAGTRGRVRAFHAPGGSGAFAMARDGALLEGQWQVSNRVHAAAQAWTMRDDAFDGSALRTAGGSFTPAVRLGDHVDAGLTASFVRYATGIESARRGDTQAEFTAHLGATLGTLRIDADAGSERSARNAQLGGSRLNEYTARAITRGSLSVPTTFGTFSVRGGFRTANAYLASEGTVDAQVAGVHPIPSWHALTLDGGLQRTYLDRAAVSAAHAVLGLTLPGGFRLLAGVQREALMAATGSAPGTTYSLRIERASLAPGFARLSQRTGIVFLDLNDNGVRDRGEPGLPGIIVRAGSRSSTTDQSGRYDAMDEGGSPVIDVRTLAEGQRAGTAAHPGSRDLPVRATARLDVSVRREESFGRHAGAAVAIIVSAKDATGHEWVVVADDKDRAHFDALPTGDYVVTAASNNVDAPLRIEPTRVHVDAGAPQPIQLELVSRARPIRMQGGAGTAGSGTGNDGASGRGSLR
jgi:hypothetical protein